MSLLRTAIALLDAPRLANAVTELTGIANPTHHTARFGDLALISPPGRLDGTSLRWRHGPRPLGADAARWL